MLVPREQDTDDLGTCKKRFDVIARLRIGSLRQRRRAEEITFMVKLRALNLVVLFLVAGCATGEGPKCDPNPEPLQPLLLQKNGKMQNGMEMNGIEMNDKEFNGMEMNGIEMNGTRLNGQSFNGQTLNGETLNGTELTGTTADGKILGGADFVGATIVGVLSDGTTIDLVITNYAMSDGIARYTLTADGKPLCADGAPGVLVAGVWDATGARHDSLTVGGHAITTSYSCLTGAIGKCVLWGYEPSRVGADLHQSCTRMVRADYCGSGVSFTKDGTLIDVFDTLGVQQPTRGDASLLFEAAWTTTGAACVSRTRYEAVTESGEQLLPSCWARLPKCESWTSAQQSGALLGDASRAQTRTICR
jgi:hypothetical protein